MTLLLDAFAVAAVIGALVFLWRGRGRGCADCAPRRGAESRVSLADLRASARRAAERR
jgi:hypothetical protein